MTLTTAVFQNLKTPLAVVVGQDDDCHFNLANKAFSRLVGCSGDVLEGLPPDRVFSEWSSSALRSDDRHETSLLRSWSDDDPLRLVLTCEAIAGADEPAFLLTVEDISAKSWIDRMAASGQVLLSGILNERLVVERYYKHYPAPVVDRLFSVEEESLSQFFHDSERERILASLKHAALHRRTEHLIVHTKRLAESVQLELQITYRPFFHGDGTLKCIAFIATDIRSLAETEAAALDPSVTLKVLMARKYMSAQQLSSATGISLQTISKLRNGKIGRPQRQTTLLIAKALEVAPQDIWP
ncbi:helix-turn-helix transcriptional regulator [Paenibacillus sp. MWE-103]|uniref:Helix-turn-helix transcriptional regulator n=1 Tax=Paenibacillus artemisiicola TaxID=1172618 RepID=A0ABS3WIH2_9BACL|nr:helix-turn-helix transcriptional regulator [Paenibacillus artemisiicola]MBO7748095.1 helix-turn-helix transcriptional regulator [Paenibacillus artemisiicola]